MGNVTRQQCEGVKLWVQTCVLLILVNEWYYNRPGNFPLEIKEINNVILHNN